MEKELFTEEYFAIPIINIKGLEKDKMYMTNGTLSFYDPSTNELDTYIKLKNVEKPYPIDYFILLQNLVNCPN